MVETLRYIGGSTAPDAMRRDRDGWKLTMHLRMIHLSRCVVLWLHTFSGLGLAGLGVIN